MANGVHGFLFGRTNYRKAVLFLRFKGLIFGSAYFPNFIFVCLFSYFPVRKDQKIVVTSYSFHLEIDILQA